MTRNLELTPRLLTKFLIACVSLLLLANIIGIYFKFVKGLSPHFFKAFYFDAEANMPSFYSFLTLALSSYLLVLIGLEKKEKVKKTKYFWIILACTFAFLAVDELIGFHETLNDNGRALLGAFRADGYLHYAWVLPYCALFFLVLVFILRPFLRLPSITKITFVAAGFIYVSGAVGMEMIGGRHIYLGNDSEILLAIIVSIEELLEMIGIVIFIHGLSTYYTEILDNNEVNIRIALRKGRRSRTSLS